LTAWTLVVAIIDHCNPRVRWPQRVSNSHVVFELSGGMDAENLAELKKVIESEASALLPKLGHPSRR